MAVLPVGTRRRLMRHPLGWLAAGFGAGFSPRAPVTVGSLAALLPWWLFMRDLSLPLYLAVLAVGFGVGVWASHWAIRETKIEDPSLVVWDEFIGMWITLLMAPAGWAWMLAAFVLFRLFDIWKPWPVSWADQKLHGGFGAMLDDAIAGLYALGVLQLAAWWLH
ncbi:MAG: phosphatidylglycerophosphatase A [Arenimonas sp.]|uniref:phosphatidylglycerophosphatase A family protein n=1 Tax=Arenimonas sp. TaxID=1872635 RepID=UPI0025BCF12B|nr:phosphatidylglycerophosphatase A [Arenimonas sp.]MBW8366629.1 phosphatidylglycerophosphatase A [Arenimonas sp.]